VARMVIMIVCVLRNMVFPIRMKKRSVTMVIERFAHTATELTILLIHAIKSMVTHPVTNSKMVRLILSTTLPLKRSMIPTTMRMVILILLISNIKS